MAKKILLAIAVILVVIQFIKPEKNIHAGTQPNSITSKYAMPDTVNKILTVACYDCHSNNTRYPWYNKTQPIAWWLNDHVTGGKKHFNFDEFTTYSLKRQDHKLEELIASQDEGWMPLESYTFIHKDALLNASQKKILTDWAKDLRKEIQANPDFAASPAK
ncbi:heme-binding domain-containing protein [Pedobacter sp. SD-b]|uniref:Heme-binding domain-containing protein n=1 Tax=Pedobacter segetis TaxID=2793069 RepID=A0ABS1BFH3_9SPHI|nr:heme-binding domain-containing protein [Pedobacter segetis]MBK0381601.1 heme-binding domain-containing protein [Pedobacter segetis]